MGLLNKIILAQYVYVIGFAYVQDYNIKLNLQLKRFYLSTGRSPEGLKLPPRDNEPPFGKPSARGIKNLKTIFHFSIDKSARGLSVLMYVALF